MPAWLIPALKTLLPHVGTIVSAAAPVFTKKSADAAANQALLQQQITELQSAASDNDAHIKALATQMQTAVEALEKETSLAEKRFRRAVVLGISSLAISVMSLGAVLFLWAAR